MENNCLIIPVGVSLQYHVINIISHRNCSISIFGVYVYLAMSSPTVLSHRPLPPSSPTVLSHRPLPPPAPTVLSPRPLPPSSPTALPPFSRILSVLLDSRPPVFSHGRPLEALSRIGKYNDDIVNVSDSRYHSSGIHWYIYSAR